MLVNVIKESVIGPDGMNGKDERETIFPHNIPIRVTVVTGLAQ